MKMTKSQFKVLMKECLSELINEGAFDKKLERIAESKMSGQGQAGMLYGNSGNPSQPATQASPGINPKLLEAVRNVTAATPSDRKSMFESIMLDTALNTLQNQIANGDGFGAAGGMYNDTPVSAAVVAHDEAQLNALAGGNASRWALAAFGNKKR